MDHPQAARVVLLDMIEPWVIRRMTVLDIACYYPDSRLMPELPEEMFRTPCPIWAVPHVLAFLMTKPAPTFTLNGVGYVKLKGHLVIPWFKPTQSLLDTKPQPVLNNAKLKAEVSHFRIKLIRVVSHIDRSVPQSFLVRTFVTPKGLKTQAITIPKRILSFFISLTPSLVNCPIGTILGRKARITEEIVGKYRFKMLVIDSEQLEFRFCIQRLRESSTEPYHK